MRFLFVLANLLLAADVPGISCLVMARVCLSVVATLRGRICSKPTAAGLIFLVGCSSVSIASVWCPCCLCMVLHVASVWCCLCMVSSCCLLPLLPLLPVASRMWAVAHGRWAVACGLWPMEGFLWLWPMEGGLWPVGCGLWPVACGL